MPRRKGKNQQGCPCKHPFIDRKDVVLADDRIEKRQIERKGELCEDTHQIATDVTHLGIARTGTAENQDKRTTTANGHTHGLLPSDGLLEDEERKHHGKDGHRCGDDARIDR